MSNFQISTIEENCELSTGFPFKSKTFLSNGDGIIRLARGDNIKEGLFQWGEKEKRLPVMSSEFEKYELIAGDVLVSMDGSKVGKNWVSVSEDDLPCYLVQRVCRLRGKSNLLQGLIKYLICGKEFRNYVDAVKTGTSIPHISLEQIKKFPIFLPPLEDQKAIINILGTLDKKIRLNQKTNETLEEIAKSLFKSWFVDFDPVKAKSEGRSTGLPDEISNLFPDSFESSELGEIPKSWRIDVLSNHLSITKGKSYKSIELQESQNALVTLKSFQRGGGYREEGLKPYTGNYKKEQIILPGELIIALTDVTQAADLIGRPAIVQTNNLFENLIASLDVGIIRAKKTGLITKEYSIQLLKTPKYVSHALTYTSGTTVLHLAKELFESFCFVIPDYKLIKNFTSFYNEILQKIDLNQTSSNNLAKVRDVLLPKLISGEIRIPDAEKMIEEVGI